MFNKLKEKLKAWTKKVSEEVEATEEIEENNSSAGVGGRGKTPKEDGGEIKSKPKEQKPLKQEKQVEKTEKKEFKKQKKEEKKKERLEKKEKRKKEHEKIEENINEEPMTQEERIKPSKNQEKRLKVLNKQFEEYAEDLEFLLLENNVAIEVTEKIIQELKNKLLEKEFSKKNIEKEINQNLKEIINEILIEPFDLIKKIKEHKEKPYIILFCGINGSGKTTTVAKFAYALKQKGISCVLGAADTFRAAAVEQLKKHGEKLDIKVIAHDYGADPASVGFDTIQYAKKNHLDCVILDTAGRMHTATNLLKEMEKIKRITKPNITIFTGESITGNDATEQIKAFHNTIGIDAIILSKADIDEKGGTALSVGYTTKKPILYLGTGQEYKDLEPFDKKRFIEKLGL
jgi:fused signal recognition particle receptor